MTESSLAPMRTWLAAPMDHDVSEAIERLRRAPDVQQIAVMPDVHLAPMSASASSSPRRS